MLKQEQQSLITLKTIIMSMTIMTSVTKNDNHGHYNDHDRPTSVAALDVFSAVHGT